MMQMINGSQAIMLSAVQAGCRFYSGYPMTPATKILEAFSDELPKVGGVCMLAESELEAAGMAWGAAATGSLAAVGSTAQGLDLMQESFAEITVAGLPLVIFNMARGQSDYFQSTRGGGHGDYRTMVLAPIDIREAVELTALAFHLTEKWRIPVVLHCDYLIAHGTESVDVKKFDFPKLPARDWALDGSTTGTGKAKIVSPFTDLKGGAGSEGVNIERRQHNLYKKLQEITAQEQRIETAWTEDAEVLVTAWGSAAKFTRQAVKQLREQGYKIGFFRPISLYPFPKPAIAKLSEGKKQVIVFETNFGQMLDDVELSVLGRAPVNFIGEYSNDASGFGVGALLNTEIIRNRIKEALSQPAKETV
jgi:2-oxoglutarate ferredoxin oxidoreductase subunit alpha